MGCENVDPQVEAADAAIRSALAQSGTAYQVLYGDPNDRLSQALKLVEAELQQPSSLHPGPVDEKDGSTRAWVWLCDKCSDPQCEHRLLSDLLASRTTEGGRASY